MNKIELTMLQNLSLELKIAKSKRRIEEWINYYGKEGCYVSFSGGKDSTVLLHLVRQVCEDIPVVYVDTGLEYPEVKTFAKYEKITQQYFQCHKGEYDLDLLKKINKKENLNSLKFILIPRRNLVMLKPEKSFKQVIEEYGYPMVSKEQANYLDDIRNSTEKMRMLRLNGDSKGRFKLSNKWKYLIDAPFKISHRCCLEMKKKPIKIYERKTGRVPFLGTMAYESRLREQSYLKTGCNAFESKRPVSTPLGFWTEQDILEYIKKYDLEIASVYGDIVENKEGKLETTLCDRTGCVFCGFGVHLEKGENRYQRLERTHPQLHNYCMNNLGFKEVCEFMNIPYKN